MAAPQFISATNVTAYTTSGSSKSITVTTQAGDLVVVYGGGEDSPDTLGTPSGNSIAFTARQSIVATNYSTAYMWTGTDSVGGNNWTLSVAHAGSKTWGFTALVFRNTAGVGTSTKTNSTGTPASLGITTTQNNSAIVVVNADWNAVDGSGRVWYTVNGITPTALNSLEVTYASVNGGYTIYGGYYNDAGTAGVKTVGISGPTGQEYALIALEVLPSSAPPVNIQIAWFTT